jgi:hypothetical protein
VDLLLEDFLIGLNIGQLFSLFFFVKKRNKTIIGELYYDPNNHLYGHQSHDPHFGRKENLYNCTSIEGEEGG